MMRITFKNTLNCCKQILRFEERKPYLRRTSAAIMVIKEEK